MSGLPRELHISSAVVVVSPEHEQEVAEAVGRSEGVEIYAQERGRLVIVIEGGSTGEVGERLAGIALLPNVIAANLVYELVESHGRFEEDNG